MANKDLLNRQRQALKAFLQAEDKRAETEQVLEETRATNLSQTDGSFQSTKDAADSLVQKSHGYRDEAHSKLISIESQHLLTDLPEFVPKDSIHSFDALEELGKQASIVKASSDAIVSSVKSLKLNRVIRRARRQTILAVVAISVIAVAIFGVIYFRDELLPQQEAGTQQQEIAAQVEGQAIASSAGPTSTPTSRPPTNTPRPPTSTPRPPTNTPQPPTSTPRPPTATPVPVVSCANEPQGEFRSLWGKYKDRLGCPHQTDPISGFHAEQQFQNGHMFWSKLGGVYLITIGGNSGTWRLFFEDESPWKEGMPQTSCDVEVPPGLFQPVRGFGGLWCAHSDIREQIGWALGDEGGFQDGIDLIQGFDGGIIFRDSDGYTHGLAYVLFRDDMSFVREGY